LLQGSRLITDAESRDESTDTLLRLSRRFGLASKAMSLVAVVKRAGDVAGDLPVTRVVPVGMPQDVEFGAYFASMAPTGAPAAAPMQARYCIEASSISANAMPRAPRGIRNLFRSAGRAENVPTAPPPPDDEDRLMELAAQMEPDGGMPGTSLEARIKKTVEAIHAFAEAGHTRKSGAFRSHVKRLVEFLKAVEIPPALEELANDAMKAVS